MPTAFPEPLLQPSSKSVQTPTCDSVGFTHGSMFFLTYDKYVFSGLLCHESLNKRILGLSSFVFVQPGENGVFSQLDLSSGKCFFADNVGL